MPHENDPYLLQWSEHDHQFHIEQATSILKATIGDFLSGGTHDGYVTLAIAPTYEDADRLCHELAKKRGMIWDEAEMCWKDKDVT